MQGFIEKILQQCRDVMAKHKQYSIDDYTKIGTYRGLEMEMIEVKVVSFQKKSMLLIPRLFKDAFCLLSISFRQWPFQNLKSGCRTNKAAL